MERQLSNTIYGLKFAMEKNDFEGLKSSGGKKQNDFVANPIVYCAPRVKENCSNIINLIEHMYLTKCQDQQKHI